MFGIIQNIHLSFEYAKYNNIMSSKEVQVGCDQLNELYENAYELNNVVHEENPTNTLQCNAIIDELQKMYDKLSFFLSIYGTIQITDILYVLFGGKYIIDNEMTSLQKSKWELIEKYVYVTGYKQIGYKPADSSLVRSSSVIAKHPCSNKIKEESLDIESEDHLECFDSSSLFFHQTVFGIQILIKYPVDSKSILIQGVVKNIPFYGTKHNLYIKNRLDHLEKYLELHLDTVAGIGNRVIEHKYDEVRKRWMENLTLKELFVFGDADLLKKYGSVFTDVQYMKVNPIDKIIKHFFDMDITSKRKMLSNLLVYDDNEIQYIAYMLYDLMGSNDNTESIDNREQTLLYNSLSWKLKQYFKECMTKTLTYTNETIQSGDLQSKISLEQRVLLMRVDDKIKRRAMAKLSEIKGKPDENGGKAKQYLEGLIKIPFNIYRKEPLLCFMENMNELFLQTIHQMRDHTVDTGSVVVPPSKKNYTMYEINIVCQRFLENLGQLANESVRKNMKSFSKKILLELANIISTRQLHHSYSGLKTKTVLIEYLDTHMNEEIVYHILGHLQNNHPCLKTYSNICEIQSQSAKLQSEMKNVHSFLDASIFGHQTAKSKINKIIGQWITGEQSGYCFGFEGSPGIGKTSLAKRGLAECLRDENGNSRPFAFIAMGGSCNGSTLEGHNYTYVNSTWGKIVDILMESKCMNPIIYIDELDKVSKTEQGREIIGILTHLTDTTQNDEFQDKYFAGIPINLSKILFIFSYNDPEQVDRILLDRIHRIKFDNLSWTDKLVIVRDFILPELNAKMGFQNTVSMEDDVVEYLIEQYTMEPGVRKLKELLFDIYGEINLMLLSSSVNEPVDLPIQIQKADLGTKYLKTVKKIQEKQIHTTPTIGMINGMWANALGKGGIIPIETMFYPGSSFLDLRLTGMQGDVMKESMNVAKTLAWSLTPLKRQKELFEEYGGGVGGGKSQGIHIHCPEGAVSKDGPSAGTAIAVSIYSLLNQLAIRHNVSITGEVDLHGNVMAIGGLEAKILGSIRAGVLTILYPASNQTDFDEFYKKYSEIEGVKRTQFHSIGHVNDAIALSILDS